MELLGATLFPSALVLPWAYVVHALLSSPAARPSSYFASSYPSFFFSRLSVTTPIKAGYLLLRTALVVCLVPLASLLRSFVYAAEARSDGPALTEATGISGFLASQTADE